MATDKRKESRLPIPEVADWNPAEPVSSTLAANLAPHLSSQGDGTLGQTKEAFSQLRHELLEGKYSHLQLNDSITDVKKLICIVLKAGLEPCIRDDRSELQGQLLDCLDIVQNAVDKAPLALLEMPEPEVLGKDAASPLYSCLVVWLVHLFSTWDSEPVEDRIGGILASMFNASHNHTKLWSSFVGITAFVRACTTELLDALDAYQSRARLTHVAGSPVVYPKQPCTLDLDRLGLRCGSLKRLIRLDSCAQTVRLCLDMLTSTINAHVSYNIPSKRQDLAWLSNSYRRLWKLAVLWRSKADTEDVTNQVQTFSQFLRFIKRFCDHVPHTSAKQRLAYIFLQTFAETFALEMLNQASVLQLSLSHAIDSFTKAFTSEKDIMQSMGATVLPIKSNLALFSSFDTCLQVAIECSLVHCPMTYNSSNAKGAEAAFCGGHSTEMVAIHEFPGFDHSSISGVGAVRMAKHRCLPRLDAYREGRNVTERLIANSLELLGCDRSGTLGDLSCAVLTSYIGLSEQDKLRFLRVLCNIPCALSGNLVDMLNVDTEDNFNCRICDSKCRDIEPESNSSILKSDELCQILNHIISNLSRTANLRIAATVALRRTLMHTSDPAHMQLASSAFGEFCLNSLRSSVRELRLTTGHSITSFVRRDLDHETRRGNFIVILDWLQSLSEKQETPLHETCILTLCHLAQFSNDEEMNIILLRLVEYLGHPNPFIGAVAYTELSGLAQHLSVTPAALFRPFWRTLSVTVVRNFQSRPYMAEQLCDLLGMKVDDFLRLTETYVLPYLVLTRKRDVIVRVGATYKDAKTPFDICSEKNNLASILAFLLSQPSPNPEESVMSALSEVDAAFRGRTLAELLRIEPILIACDLLKGLGDLGEDKGKRFLRALHLLAVLVPRKSGHTPKRANLIGYFIEEHVLGIITQFAHAVNDFQIRQPLIEKKRNIAAIGEMIKVARGHISSALPQICACLRAALEIQELCNNAFIVWRVLIISLQEEEVEPLIDQTLSIVIRYWDMFTEDTRKQAHELVEYIMQSHHELVRDIFNTMPSLASIPILDKHEATLNSMKEKMDVRSHFLAFIRRCQSDTATVVEQSLHELVPYLSQNEEFIHRSVLSEIPDPVVAQLTRSLLDCCVKFNTSSDVITKLSAECLGLIGCLDPNRVDTVKEKKGILVLSNFDSMEETFDFILFFLQNVLVETFLSASNTRAQGFLAYAMQNLLRFCGLDSAVANRSRDFRADEKYQRWLELPETVRNILAPFLTSKYTVTIGTQNTNCSYPLFTAGLTHGNWLRTFVQDLLQAGNGDNAKLVFSVCSRIVKGQDISIASFLLPFAVLNRTVSGSPQEKEDLRCELVNVLSHPLPDTHDYVYENIILCSQSIFEVLDYLSRWLQGKKKQINSLRNPSHPSNRNHKGTSRDALLDTYHSQAKAVEILLSSIPPEVISKRAVECKSFSRALFHWEQYIRQWKTQHSKQGGAAVEPLYQRLQDIYSRIDEPDGIEGISSHLHVLNIDQQVLEHRKAGRWATAQSWYELQLEKEPNDSEAQWGLLACLKESGQQDAILTRFEILKANNSSRKFLPFAVEATWITSNWGKLNEYLQQLSRLGRGEFNIEIGLALNAFRQGKYTEFWEHIEALRLSVAKSLTANSVVSLQSCHDSILKLHTLHEVESIARAKFEDSESNDSRTKLPDILDRRLDILGGYISDKQYLLGLRRATMELTNEFTDSDIAAAWLTSARLSRKGNFTNQAYQSMLHAARLNDRSATIEHARLLWKDGHHRKAIQTLEGAITANEFSSETATSQERTSSLIANNGEHQNMLLARAHLLLAKWTDRAGQTQSDAIVQRYREAIKLHPRWEKAHYYLGKHYNKILDLEKAKPLGKEAQIYLSGEASKLVVDNYLRSLAHGNKYVFQSLPKILTLWLEHASTVDQPFDPKRGDNEDFQKHTLSQRKKSLDDMHTQLKKYVNRIPAALLFTILPQVVARICHPNTTVYDLLTKIVARAVNSFPQQGLWTVLAVVKSSSKDRASRGINCLQKITEVNKKLKNQPSSDMRGMINQGQKFSEEMLRLCIARIEDKVLRVSLRDLKFSHKVAPCRLVVPFQAMLTPTLPASHKPEYLKGFRAFPRDPTTIEAILDDVQVLNSLQKPRRIGIRGSDGKVYNILCKPKDDLRKDQRLMEFNNMINRLFKKDVESSKRRMYIKTYAVTPLNEECGLIEWVDNLRALRDIVIKLLRERGIAPNYNEIRHDLNEACSDNSKLHLFTTKVLSKFPPVLYEWFIEMFPEAGSWFAARIRYTRSCAVMSMVGHVLGLGDRHGENILFEEGTGGVLHVDFNCLFDKGLTFDIPELVPFRLTQNMVDAFGAYGYNGPFRKTCEISLGLLRHNEDALMTVLETFLHDPTTDFIGKKRRTHANAPETPAGVLENVRNKLRGLLPGESVPLSVDGHVDELIVQATDVKNLAAMYIGWCAFF
ncbi:protein kinase MEC1 [Aspergillus luchuensis]|uniref:Serine/threonine-protein kinase MEC1 n=1 Tax=Aspergillus kawachii TaxID=1069201 RepID=A0A7R7WY43_ASPKA|nr:serine/threonine-protein kinase M1 [Aspergillus luchuensis]BCR99011.1 serine/threonine-protein kinase M1 [Aspergillus luchuensis]BCS11323.1 serine/threonine-protein kinase M1 [Aspergillus luchuensis]